ncbi:MAG: CdvA-like protein [Candidatus Bathyarchaeia archaeon]
MGMKDYLSKRVYDGYGRILGKVIACTRSGEVDPLLGIELLGGGFLTLRGSCLTPKGEDLFLNESWKSKSEAIKRELSIAKRKVSALERLYSQGEISKETYDVLSSEYGANVSECSKRKETLQREIEERSKILTTLTRTIEDYVVNLKIGHELGEVEDEEYKSGRDSLNKLLSQLQAEQKDIDAAIDLLIGHLAPLERPIEKKTPPVSETLQELPILVRIKEAEPRMEG